MDPNLLMDFPTMLTAAGRASVKSDGQGRGEGQNDNNERVGDYKMEAHKQNLMNIQKKKI